MKFKVGDKVRLKNNYCVVGYYGKRLEDSKVVYKVRNVYENFIALEGEEGYWHCNWFEKVEPKKIKIEPIKDEIKLQYCGRSTIAMHNGKVGTTFRSYDDNEDRKIGVLIAAMRALGFSKSTVNKVVDVLFDDLKEIDKCTTEELLKEIIDRVK